MIDRRDAVLVPVPVVRGSHGAVVAPHHLATTAGLGVLRAGGSAVDAAIAANAVLAVVMPNACGVGGDAFWLIWDERERRLHALNGSGRSSRSVDPNALRQSGFGRLPLRGPLSVTVPGAVRSWADAHRRFGRLSTGGVLGPAIELARDGFAAWEGLIESVDVMARIVDAELDADSASRFRRHYRGGDNRAWRPGEVVRFPALAATLERIADVGFDDFYDGEIGERQAAFLAAAGSPIGADDLRAHTSTWVEPLRGRYRNHSVATHPPNSSGLIALEILGVLDRLDSPAPRAFGGPGLEDVDWIHLGIEASKLAMADRDLHLTDPEARPVPTADLLSDAHAAELASRIDRGRAAPAPPARSPVGGGTIYLAAVDGQGNAVSLIESHYMGFGSGLVDPETGIHYHNRGSYFSLDPGHPNVLEPGKRTLHTLMPWMLFEAGAERPRVVGGSMGGDAQPQIAAQVISALVDGAVDVGTAVAAPRWFVEPEDHFAPPVVVLAEPRFAPGVLEALVDRGHPLTPAAPFDSGLGHCHLIELVDGGPANGGSLAAATDPRSAGLPAVW